MISMAVGGPWMTTELVILSATRSVRPMRSDSGAELICGAESESPRVPDDPVPPAFWLPPLLLLDCWRLLRLSLQSLARFTICGSSSTCTLMIRRTKLQSRLRWTLAQHLH